MENPVKRKEYLSKGAFVILQNATRCDFHLIDDDMKNVGKDSKGIGGQYTLFPAKLIVPQDGNYIIEIVFFGDEDDFWHNITIQNNKFNK